MRGALRMANRDGIRIQAQGKQGGDENENAREAGRKTVPRESFCPLVASRPSRQDGGYGGDTGRA